MGPLSQSFFDLGHTTSAVVSNTLTAGGIDHFVVSRRGDGLEFGVALADRSAASAALDRIDAAGWYLMWADGGRSGFEPLDRRNTRRHVMRAREWNVFQAFAWGDQAVGVNQGAVISFWDRGSSGLLEKIGDRDQERFDERCPVTTEVVDGRPYPGRTAFPVGANLEHVADPIDIVYTWVDGADPDWREAFRATAREVGRSIDETALDPARYHSRDELKYSLRSVWAHCGWARTIWIVTAGQRPDWLGDDPRVRLVDHFEILPASALPTFNSHAIEAALHRIDGLAEQFIYLNDDMLIARSTRPEAFFTPNGLPLVFQSDARPPGVEDGDTLAVDTGALRGRELLAATFGRVATAKPYHSPYPLSRAAMVEMEQRFADIVAATQHSRFRASSDLSTAASFAQHYALATRRAVLGDIATEYVHVESGRLDWHLDRIRLDDRLLTYCINETHRDGGDHDDRERRITEFFEQMLPVGAPWER
ncbi:Stealth CR1 domain-containing protein [Ilumatobacter sp.]|uniref:stealth family protein n=1 Tax=Ilumatobacter sp. TaxID=1967498 RepID=UPI003C57E7F7